MSLLWNHCIVIILNKKKLYIHIRQRTTLMHTFLPLKSKSVLYVDEDVNSMIQVKEVLEDLFGQVTYISNSKDAINIYTKKIPDLPIIVIRYTIADWSELIESIRKYNYYVPIIVLSERMKQKNLIELVNLSIDAFLYEPINIELFKETIYKSTKRISYAQK
jgi:two-component system, OmpR family, response regulator VanR